MEKSKLRSKSKNAKQSGDASLASLEPFLAKLLLQFHHSHWIASDPIQYAHQYSKPDDQEIAAFIAATFAYGSVTLVHRAVKSILAPMGQSPSSFVRSYNGQNYWAGFYHRFHHEDHVVSLVWLLKKVLCEYGSLNQFFRRMASEQTAKGDRESLKLERALNGVAQWFKIALEEELDRSKNFEIRRGMRFFFNAPSDGSACKRMVMFLRWMVRKDQIDLGLWDWLSPRELVIPADTHVSRISFYLGLRGGHESQAANWKMAKEITRSLSIISPADPVQYDFALARLGILDICKRKYTKSVCERCPVQPGCRFSNLKVNHESRD